MPSARLRLAASAPFSVTQNTCSGSLAAGANCTASIVFQPSAGGSASGSLTVSSSAVATPATVALSGIGFDFAVAVTGSASQTVARGQQANYTLVITPSGASGSFAFACGTLPSNAICIFNPTTESLSAGVQGNVEVEISTSNGSAASADRPASVADCAAAVRAASAAAGAGQAAQDLSAGRDGGDSRRRCIELHQLRRRRERRVERPERWVGHAGGDVHDSCQRDGDGRDAAGESDAHGGLSGWRAQAPADGWEQIANRLYLNFGNRPRNSAEKAPQKRKR